jgi:hypothetical protein
MKPVFLRIVIMAAILLVQGCSTMFHPKWTAQEKEVLKFNVQGIKLGSPASHLGIFSQIKKDSTKQDLMDVYEVYNPNSHISIMLAWYLQNKLRKVELRYFNSNGVDSLKVSGGWEGIRDDLIEYYGPPSNFGPNIPVVATQEGLDPQLAKFNGVWIFSRVNRQVNFIAFSDETGTGSGFVNITNTTPLTKKENKATKPFPGAKPPPPPTASGPGF